MIDYNMQQDSNLYIDTMSDEFNKLTEIGPGQSVFTTSNCTMVLIYRKLYNKYKKHKPSGLLNLFTDCVYVRFRTIRGTRALYIGKTNDFFGRYGSTVILRCEDDRCGHEWEDSSETSFCPVCSEESNIVSYKSSDEKLPDWEFALVFTLHKNNDLGGVKERITKEKLEYLEAKLIRSFNNGSNYELCNSVLYKNALPVVDRSNLRYLTRRHDLFIELIHKFTNYGKCFNKDDRVAYKELQITTALSRLEDFRNLWINDNEMVNRRERWRGMRAKPSQRSFSESIYYLHGMVKYIDSKSGKLIRNEHNCAEMISKSGKEYRRDELKCTKETLFKAQDQPYLKFLGMIDTFRNRNNISIVLTPRGKVFAKELPTDDKMMQYVILALEEWNWAGVLVRKFCREIHNIVGGFINTSQHIDEFKYIVSHGGIVEYEPYNTSETISRLVNDFRYLDTNDREKFCNETDALMLLNFNNDLSKLRNEQNDEIEAYEDVYMYEFLNNNSDIVNKFKGTRSDQTKLEF